jgi:alpha-ribazole phosphatase
MDVYLVRHTRPDVAAGVCYGRLDVALPADFETEAEVVRAYLPVANQIVTTEAERCRRLAVYLADAAHARLVVDDRLRELDFGRWEGQSWEDIPRAQTDAWTHDIWNHSAPDGETYASLHARVSAAWESLLLIDEETLVIVGHAGPLRALLTIALELPPESFIRIHLDYGGISRLSDTAGGWRLDYANRLAPGPQ